MEILKTKYNTNKTRLYACCPFCEAAGKAPDTKYHFYIIIGGWCGCFRCNKRIKYDILVQSFKFDREITSPGEREAPPVVTADEFAMMLAQNTTSFGNSMYSLSAWSYLERRGFDAELLSKVTVLLGANKFLFRVVFVDFINQYYVGRSFMIAKPKTLNPPATLERPLMYLTKVPMKTLYIVEGIFDRVPFLKTGRESVCLLGKDMSALQARQLRSAEVGNVILALDCDAAADSIKLVDKVAWLRPLSNIGVLMYDNKRKKDPGEWGVDLFKNSEIEWVRIVDKEIMNEL